MKVMHIVASPRGAESNTLRVSTALLDSIRAEVPDLTVDTLDLFQDDLPAVAGDNVQSKYTLMHGQPVSDDHAASWSKIEQLIERFKSADLHLVSSPMWNLSIPYALKYFIDCIVQPGYTFRYNEVGQVVPMVSGKKMVVVTSRGGDYRPGTPMHQADFQEPYLRTIFGLIGITDLEFINTQPMDITAEMREAAVNAAIDHARIFAKAAG